MKKGTEIQKVFTEVQRLQFDEQVSKLGITYEVGDIFMKHGGENYIRIHEIEAVEKSEWVKGKRKRIKGQYGYQIHYGVAANWECTEWRDDYGSNELEKFHDEYGHCKITVPIASIFEEALLVIEGKKSISDYEEKNLKSEENETGLMHSKSKDTLVILKNDLEQRSKHLEMIKGAVTFEMEKRKQELNNIKDKLGLVLKDFYKKIKRIEKIIFTIELYLGINEDIVQIQEGNKADVNEKIHFRQSVLFMDEEVGDPEDDGIDFNKIQDFDDWLCRKENYKKVIPEAKGVVVIRVRRDDKHYVDNPFINAMMNKENHKTYILIRNGDCLFRIWADIIIFPRLFPMRNELQDLKDRWDAIQSKYNPEGSSDVTIKNREGNEEHINGEEAIEKMEDEIFRYKRQFIILQGLLDRTDVFNPVPHPIKLLESATLENDIVRFIYDGEVALPDSRIEFWDWHTKLNEDIDVGSRIFVIGGGVDEGRMDSRFTRDSKYSYHNIKMPTDVYTVYGFITEKSRAIKVLNPEYDIAKADKNHFFMRDRKIEDGDDYWDKKDKHQCKYIDKKDENNITVYEDYNQHNLCIKFKSNDEVRNWWDRYDDGHERKNRLRYQIFKEDKDVLNYDALSLEDVEFYLNSRVNRRHYLKMMPLLWQIKQARIEELKWEKAFVQMMQDELARELKVNSIVSDKILEQIEWYKLKNKWKRPVRKDDAKALRMIKNRIYKHYNLEQLIEK